MENEQEQSSTQKNKSQFLTFLFVTIGVFLVASYVLSLSVEDAPSLTEFVAEEVNAVASKMAEIPKELENGKVAIAEVLNVPTEGTAPAAEGLAAFCENTYKEKKQCPEDVCMFNCLGAIAYQGCEKGCYPRSCLEIPVESCPVSDCQVLKGCEDIDRCFPQTEAAECGDLAYQGQDVECCKGFVRRCGFEFFDRTCDMVGEKSVYGVPVCIPCGNGICNQFENRCNCPEDCGQP